MQQMTIFDTIQDKTQDWKQKKVRLIELFAGIGAQAAALERIGVDFEKYLISEWDAAATRSYNAIHVKDWTDHSAEIAVDELPGILLDIGISTNGKTPMTLEQIKRKGEKWQRATYNDFKATRNIGSTTNRTGEDLKICERDKYLYIMTYSFPCQDLSIAGNCKGMKKGSGTRSGLLWEVERLLSETRELPQILLMENVTQVHNKRNASDFGDWLKYLQERGYVNFVSDINAEDHGIAQHRIRTFVVSILQGGGYHFPDPKPLETTIRDYLETSVDERYYINSERGKELIQNLIDSGEGIKEFQTGIDANTEEPKIVTSAAIFQSMNLKEKTETYFKIRQATKRGYIEVVRGGAVDLAFPNSKTRRGRVQRGGKVSPTITTGTPSIHIIESKNRIRRLTEREAWRLMGFTDEQFDAAANTGATSRELYHQAGNSIVVPVLMEIFKKMNL